MVIYGTGGRVTTEQNVKCNCNNCDAQNSIRMHIVQRYAHVFWIPFFPTKKRVVSECNNCKQVLDQDQFPTHFDKEAASFKSNSKTPWWTFSAAILLVILAIGIAITSNMNDKENAEFILNPKSGDIYELKLAAKEYTLLKVDKVVGDTVYVFENEYATDQSRGLNDLREKSYTQESFPVAKSRLKEMFDAEEILDIDRG